MKGYDQGPGGTKRVRENRKCAVCPSWESQAPGLSVWPGKERWGLAGFQNGWLCFGYAEFERSVRNRGFLGGASGKEPAYKCRRYKRHGFDPWVRKILWRREWQPTPVFLPGKLWAEEPGGLQSLELQRVGHDWSDLACMHFGNQYLRIGK